MEWIDRAGRALRKAKKMARAKEAELAALRAQNDVLRARAEAAEQEAEIATRRRTELENLLDEAWARNEQGHPHNSGSSEMR